LEYLSNEVRARAGEEVGKSVWMWKGGRVGPGWFCYHGPFDRRGSSRKP